MSSYKSPALKKPSPRRTANNNCQNLPRQHTKTRATYAAALREDEDFFNDISKQIIQIQNERDKKLSKLIEFVEDHMRDRPNYSEDHAQAPRCHQLLHQLHETLERPLLYQGDVQIVRQSPEGHGRGDSTKSTVAREDSIMPSEYLHSNLWHSTVQVAQKPIIHPPTLSDAMVLEDPRRADQLFDDVTKTPSDSANIIITTGHSYAKTGHLSMEVTEQEAMAKTVGRRQIPAKVDCLDSIKTATDQAKETKMSRRTATKSEHQAMEVSDQDTKMSGHTPTSSRYQAMEVTKQSSLETDGPRKLCLLLLGSSGNGKSSMGNSILGREEFKTSSSVNSSPPRIAMGSAQLGDQTVCVVDGPSILDSRDAGEEFMERIVASMETSLTLCDYAFSAIVIVLRFGVRFTKQEVETIKLIKAVLGKNIIQDYGICAITYGDNFEHAVEEAREDGHVLTFEGWCREQTGEVRALFEECSFRCVLFDNRTKDEDEKKTQRKLLLKMVDPTRTYSKEEFLKAEESLKEVLDKEALIHELEQQTQQLIDNTRKGMGEISEDDSLQDSNSLDSLLQQLKLHQEYIADIGLSSPKLSQLLMSLRLLQNEIHSKIRQRRLMEDNMRPTAPSSRNVFSLTSSQQTRPLPTYDLPVDGPFSVGHASSSGIKSRNMNYTSSDSDWFFEQSESNRLPTYHGHLAASSDLGRNRSLDNIWKYFRKLLGRVNIGKIYKL